MSDSNYKFDGEGLTEYERKWGKKLFDSYVDIYPHLNKLSDLQLLEQLVFHEALHKRYRKKIGTYAEGNTKVIVPAPLSKSLHENLHEIYDLKEKLGMMEDKQKLDVYQDWDALKKKFALWREKNQGSRKVTCPFCSEIFFLMIRTDKYEEKKFPFFQDKILCNKKLHVIYKEGRITKEEYAEILGVSEDFPDWLDEKWFNHVKDEDPS